MSKIIFMGTPEFAVPALQTLIETQTVVGVVTQPDRPAGRGKQLRPSPVKQLAEAADIPVYQPKSLRTPEHIVPLQAWAPEAIVVAAFGQILRPHVLDLPPLGCYNVHASLLPRWRGASPIQHAIMAGDAQTGISLMRMDPGLDTGPVHAQQALPIMPDETAATLHDRLAALGAAMLADHLDDILAGRLPAQAQDDRLATYAPMIQKEAGQLDWSRPGPDLDRHIRAMTPWPGAFTYWQGQLLKVLAALPRPELNTGSEAPGRVLARHNAILVVTGRGAIQLESVQLAGKRATTINDFVRGRPDFVGSLLQPAPAGAAPA